MDDGHSSNPVITIIIMLILVSFSAFFSATETAFSTVNRTRLKSMANQGNKKAKAALKLCENFDTLLSTTLVGNNIVNIYLASLATLFFVSLMGEIGSTISTIVITIVVLIFGEITPKSMAKENAEKVVLAFTPALSVFHKLFTPINWLFYKWKQFISKVFKTSGEQSVITDNELITIIDEATDLGGFNVEEGDLIKNAIEFADLRVTDILTPRTQVKAVQMNEDNDDVLSAFAESEYSRLPVYDENLDDIIGVLHFKDFINHVMKGSKLLKDILQSPIFVTPNMKIHDLLQMLQKEKRHLVFVADEYGGTMGIVTMEDILEELVGDILDETDDSNEFITKLDENTYLINTFAELEDVFDYLNIDDDTDANTVGGWINDKLNAIPKAGDSFETDDVIVLVTEADMYRAIEIKLTLKNQPNKDQTD